MELSENAKRMLLPPLITLPIVVGLALVGLGSAEIIEANTSNVAIPETAWPMIYIGAAILIGNGVFWPLVYTRRGKKKREERVSRRRSSDEEE